MGIGEAVELLRRSTVHIRSKNSGRASAGSGIIWSADGTVVSNAHVVAGSGPHNIELWDGRSFAASVWERDPRRDLARLTIPPGGLTAARIRAAPVKPGERVIAAGNPLGFTGAISSGVARGEGRIRGLSQNRWIQAAVRLAPGNSGGPLADASGAIVGINTMIVSGGIALAVPAAAVEDFLKDGCGPRLGVTVQLVSLPGGRCGLAVVSIEPASAAERASLLAGDVLVGAAGRPFADVADLGDAIDRATSGILRLRFLRSGSTKEREVAVLLAVPRRAAA